MPPWHLTNAKPGFHEVIAPWRLDVRREVKRTSSLPAAMFDACDPMLEARLADTAEAMLNRLREPGPVPRQTPLPDGEKRMELVTPTELQRLPQQLAAKPEAAGDLDAGLDAEFVGILADTCADATGQAQATAIDMLTGEFDAEPALDQETLTQRLWQRVRQAFANGGAANEAELTAICRQLVATVLAPAADTDTPVAGQEPER